ncbi:MULTISPECIES: DUF192 domain-containing protein [unclassified Paracoccus (in: a-proteobacteria)]|uniref:DUF192 domain-containing protein n=1 Tax=unclassified Paracoccus (in: a-proteobacteria) TaxID=2688777 RepID=UPI0012B38C1C|nr:MULTISPECIES: DUF192 domain-containing protein [unclassified Paracoccus (in: a-proteobacteria)]UXU73663.1 DUF192 domain-containing protein [Paracoccus sp. SMMA_5]UXU79552.1 DUF192 domain-containing protein [Paracoccus sp. SMMA_5_TC]
MILRAAGIVLASLVSLADPALAESCASDHAVLSGNGRRIPVSVELASTPDERARGLMFRKDLPPGHGMLFVYEQPQPVSFWMRNTLIPLDIVFFDSRGVVRHIHPMARPLDETPIPGAAPGDSRPDRLLVLELPGGDAARLGIAPGMALTHPAVPQDAAAAPCR